MHQLAPTADRPTYRSFRNAALGGVSLIAIAATALTPAFGADNPGPVLQIAQRPSQSQPPLTDKSTPWDQQRAESARDATKAMNEAIQGFKAIAQHAILTNNAGLLSMMKALIKYYGDTCDALKNRAYDIMTSGTTMTPATTKAVRSTAGNGQLGKETADHALEEIEKAQAPSSQQSQAPTRPSTSTQTAAAPTRSVSNTIIPADPARTPTVCGPGQMCTASLDRFSDRVDAEGHRRRASARVRPVPVVVRLHARSRPIRHGPVHARRAAGAGPHGEPDRYAAAGSCNHQGHGPDERRLFESVPAVHAASKSRGQCADLGDVQQLLSRLPDVDGTAQRQCPAQRRFVGADWDVPQFGVHRLCRDNGPFGLECPHAVAHVVPRQSGPPKIPRTGAVACGTMGFPRSGASPPSRSSTRISAILPRARPCPRSDLSTRPISVRIPSATTRDFGADPSSSRRRAQTTRSSPATPISSIGKV